MTGRPAALAALAADPAATALICDFDGVLAPIVEDPDASAMSPATAGALARLAGQLALVAVISGRPLAFLQERVRIPGIRLLGSYGMESSRDGHAEVAPAVAPWVPAVRTAAAEVPAAMAGWPGVRVEDKPVSVAAHWRQAPDQAAAAAQVRSVMTALAERTGLRLEPGKLVEELRPPVEVDKGTAVRELLAARPVSALGYAGDDLGDLPALHAARAAGGYALVVDHGTETAAQLLSVADEVFAGTDGFAAWLSDLAAATAR
jgi:trehalose 6-phosphate phosphatase